MIEARPMRWPLTTIAYRDGVLAADTQSTRNDSRSSSSAVKIRKRGRYLAAAAGSVPQTQRFLTWFANGLIGDCPDMGDPEGSWGEGSIFMPDGRVLLFGPQGREWTTVPLDGLYADGSGGQFALGAMAAGASAEEAVRVAIRFDTGSGGDVTVLRRGA